MKRFSRDYALVHANGRILAESHNAARLDAMRSELAEEGTVSAVVKSDLPRSDKFIAAIQRMKQTLKD
jgi:hypothetical protein